MGYGEFGGGGSVKWELDVDDSAGSGKKRAFAKGSLRNDQNPATFTITIAYHNQQTAAAAWAAIRNAIPAAGGTQTSVTFSIPFEDHQRHTVKVNWP